MNKIETYQNEEEVFYFRYVDEMVRSERDEGLSNAKPEHAAYIIRKCLEGATEKVRVFTGRLKQHKDDIAVWADNGVIEAAREFLGKPDTQLLVVAEEGNIDADAPNAHPLIRELTNAKERGGLMGKLLIRTADKVSVKFLKERDLCRHFVLMDNRGIRLETNPAKTQAHVNFNMNKSYSEAYGWVFDEVLFDVAQPFLRIQQHKP